MSSNQPVAPAYDVLLKGGRVIDPHNHIDGVCDVAIAGKTIAAVAPDIDPALAARVVDATGLAVTPGILDIHAHVYHTRAPEGDPEGLSIVADAHSFRSGVTTMVDTGTSGWRHLRHFKHTVIDRAKTRIFAYVNIVDQGMTGDFEQDPRCFDAELAADAALAYRDIVVGIKTAHYWTHKPYDELHTPWAAVDQAIRAAELCKMPVMVDFWPRPERTYPDLILKKARPGDIHTHVFAQQFPIIDDGGHVYGHMAEARARGVIFDLGHGAGSFWFRNAVRAIAGGFAPDSISTDLHTHSVVNPVVDMQTTMSKVLNMGVSLQDVIRMSTINPASEIGHPELGHLSVGACADVALFNLRTGQFGFVDCGRAKIVGDRKLECVLTIRAGEVLFDPGGLSAPLWTQAPPQYWRLPEA
ncbi:MAG: amidohydrolase/deacetylase family metallohydrolase [Chloroflexi bacterium]|nr:amidohydrolase/deacetylase family metallohydrolase [Chloroflexota bacterium]MCL5274950.1 amidohydrolase/deacetylase family metallohydrolase [Chloroflexota bacterium]